MWKVWEADRDRRIRKKATQLRRKEIEEEKARRREVNRRIEQNKKEEIVYLPLANPRLLTKANSFFYKEWERDSKFYSTMTIVLGLKRTYRMPNEIEPDYYNEMEPNKLRRIGKYMNLRDFLNDDLFYEDLAKRVKYLLQSIGFTEKDIPKFQKLEDDFEYIEEFELTIHQNYVKDYYFMWLEGYRTYYVWKLCDFLYSNRRIIRGGMRTISIEEIIDRPFNIVGDNLIFLYAIPEEQC